MGKNVAIITGGASGMGLGVSKSLAQKGWHVHVADLNVDAAKKTAEEIGGSFSATNVSDYASLHATFDQVYKEQGRINFVFANAGVGERVDFYAKLSDEAMESPPAELNKVVDIDLNSVINTSYLAQHYMSKTSKGNDQEKGPACLVLNASIAGIYPVRFCPIYTAAKHGVVGFARAIQRRFFEESGIRVNALCPGDVRTNLFKKEEWDVFTQMEWIEVGQIVKIVEMLLFDEGMRGRIVEAAPHGHFFHEVPRYTSVNVEKTLELDPSVTSLGK
ncbi:3-beta-hydroxysteroid dehydrogenase [Aulographum hederae CBS 113979]|uniref:3-beta-hydroxysteroid dehydrogenase n=1 Tax=Aulographum hederae CBS 113979 TaxID=1176131 RepID=A0A6G1GUZ4_9PEZI|nr:3-beta-hydroxysteroid dehydrogenase [Aulographum hederae CBS 113979]